MKYKSVIDDDITLMFFKLIMNGWRSLSNTPTCIQNRVIELLGKEKYFSK